MSSYFDDKSREISAAHEVDDFEERLAAVQAVEEELFRDVTAITGDREFPDDLRERMLAVLAVRAVYQPGNLPVPEKALSHVTHQTGFSRAVEDLHDLHHELASRRLRTRFGVLSDSPALNRALRDDHDDPEG
jgi:hypothetical protein